METAVTDRTTQPYGAILSPGHARLVCVAGPGPSGMSYGVTSGEHVAGSGDGAAIKLASDPTASPQHAKFTMNGGTLTVEDLGSTNGVYMRLRAPHTLEAGDGFRVGDQYFRFEMLDVREEYPSADQTLHFTSPQRKGTFRVVQVLEGGLEGLANSSSTDQLTIGGEGCTVAFSADDHLSSEHAKVYAAGSGRYALEDSNSSNGTYIRTRGPVQLQHGDCVFVGSTLIRVEVT